MEEVPFSAGLQLIDADLASKGIERIYSAESPNFDALADIETAFAAAKK
jgi:hypothetical protein